MQKKKNKKTMKEQSVWKKNKNNEATVSVEKKQYKKEQTKTTCCFRWAAVSVEKKTANQNDMLFSLRVELATKAICLNGFSIFIN